MEYTVKSNNPYESEVARMIEQFRKQQIQVMQKDDFKVVPIIDRRKWKPCVHCKQKCAICLFNESGKCNRCKDYNCYVPMYRYCPDCGKPLVESAWKELERKVFGE